MINIKNVQVEDVVQFNEHFHLVMDMELDCTNLGMSPAGVEPTAVTTAGGTVDFTISNPLKTTVNYSSSIEFSSPESATNHVPIFEGNSSESWIHISSGATGTVGAGTVTLTITLKAGPYVGAFPTDQLRTAFVKIFQEIDGTFTNINPNDGNPITAMSCLVTQNFNIENKNVIIIVNSCGDAKKDRDILKKRLGKI